MTEAVIRLLNKIHQSLGIVVSLYFEDTMIAGSGEATEKYDVIKLERPFSLRVYGEITEREKALIRLLAERYPLIHTGAVLKNRVILSVDISEKSEIMELFETFILPDTGLEPAPEGLIIDLDAIDYAELIELCSAVLEDAANALSLSIFIGIGGVFANELDLEGARRQSETALKRAKDLGQKLAMREYKDMFFEVPEDIALRNAYIKGLYSVKGMEEFLSPEFIRIFNMFLKKNLNISDTSREVYLHRNTVKYKFDKLFKLSGLDIRSFNDASIFKQLVDIV